MTKQRKPATGKRAPLLTATAAAPHAQRDERPDDGTTDGAPDAITRGLREMFNEVANEPLPQDLLDLVDRLAADQKKRRQ
ncbi:MAG: NepR family anti-sigma factor [Azospirillaceae bacterium]|nr:NepR family anti-sigma factor [Azospirillaceae bacterium]